MKSFKMCNKIVLLVLFLCLGMLTGAAENELMGPERIVIQTQYGDITFGIYRDVAPITAPHMLKLFRMGAFNTNHIFRIDQGFVAQILDVTNGRTAPMNDEQREEASKKVPLEVNKDVKHEKGVVSMGRASDPDSGTSSFSILLGAAPHLDMQYTVFGKVTDGWPVLDKLQTLETRKEGIFVMPKERVTILSTYVYNIMDPFDEERDLQKVVGNGQLPYVNDVESSILPLIGWCGFIVMIVYTFCCRNQTGKKVEKVHDPMVAGFKMFPLLRDNVLVYLAVLKNRFTWKSPWLY